MCDDWDSSDVFNVLRPGGSDPVKAKQASRATTSVSASAGTYQSTKRTTSAYQPAQMAAHSYDLPPMRSEPQGGGGGGSYLPGPEISQDELELWEHRRMQFNVQVDAATQEENIVKSEIQKQYTEVIREQQGLSDWTEQVFELKTTRYIPEYVNTVSISKTFVTLAANVNTGDIPPWQPVNAKVAFGSHDSYAQGLCIPLRETPSGNLANTFIARVYLESVDNKLPFAVGVSLGEMKEPSKETQHKLRQGSQQRFHPLVHMDVTDPRGVRVHGVIPSGRKERIELYRSHEEINHKWGGRYPNVTADTVMMGKQAYGNDRTAVPVLSPVAEHIIEMGGEAGFDLPEPPSEHEGFKDSLIVSNRTYAEAVKSVRGILQRSLPIQDMERFCMQFHAYDKTGSAKSDVAALGEQSHPMRGVSFMLVVELVFREQFDETMEWQQQM